MFGKTIEKLSRIDRRADALLFSLIIKGITKKKYYLYT